MNENEVNRYQYLDLLLIEINDLRDELIKIGLKEGINSDNAIQISQKLDKYILEYQEYRMLNNLP
ncbi:aspartyl-phosphate phosphatase Spo0E family protein [Bacillus sp. B1-b2]|uniref:aspartyl-phosphate phosphatase Spo0E family protein n=1 Tax=Bacillus sp. B1-b2 TaxID=2653201 RepID=UPI001261782C|nr:aspartyl-phosphate phosphatase Spo0E family protein [Bacillus sp. B1-b2]KAB7664311.1 aspartyl-phosphate phosphatase Spo0E family protein [Bacillus sp. B1-b2]